MAESKAKPKQATKTQIVQSIAEATGLSKKEVQAVFDSLGDMIKKELGKKGPGVFALMGLVKFTTVHKKAQPAGNRPHPFKPGETMVTKAKPARTVVKARPLKGLRDMV